ncbi:MAG: hypothetical protein HRU38_06920 [Saccharospirillaceae bacterium]|nr:hypothetical protein [Saccharospirillaceae bacterium]
MCVTYKQRKLILIITLFAFSYTLISNFTLVSQLSYQQASHTLKTAHLLLAKDYTNAKSEELLILKEYKALYANFSPWDVTFCTECFTTHMFKDAALLPSVIAISMSINEPEMSLTLASAVKSLTDTMMYYNTAPIIFVRPFEVAITTFLMSLLLFYVTNKIAQYRNNQITLNRTIK